VERADGQAMDRPVIGMAIDARSVEGHHDLRAQAAHFAHDAALHLRRVRLGQSPVVAP
jgi:hypothetical protein